jgi:adenylate cyclase
VKRHLARILVGLAITAFFAGHAGQIYRVGFIDRVDIILQDARLRLTMPGTGDARIVILDIDEKSLGELGRWPWGRDVMARLLDKLFERHRVAAVAFDVVFAEPDTGPGVAALDALAAGELKGDRAFQAAYARLRPRLEHDRLFAASMKGRPVVLGYYLNSEERAVRANAIPPPALGGEALAGRPALLTRWRGYTGNLAPLMQSAALAGHINPIVDDDGAVRRVPMLAELDGAYYEAFSLAIVRTLLALGDREGRLPPVEPGFPEGGYGQMEWLRVGALTIPVDEVGAALVPFRGRKYTFRYVSLADVLADRVAPGELEGRLAIVGATAPGLQDLRSTPVDSVYPGVEIHANLVAGILGQSLKRRPAYVLGAEVIVLLLGGIALSLLLPRLSALWATAAALGGAALAGGLSLAAWNEADLALPLAASLLVIAFVYTVNMAYGYFVESRTRRRVTELFGQYVPPELVARIATSPDRYSMEPRAAELTILFSDVRGFTSISETLAPDALREYINAYLTDMSAIIRERHRGTLDKYIGDAIMAFWGAPVEDPEHARNGVLAALEMQRHCAVLNERFRARGWPTLEIGVGINSGNVRVGDMGSRVRRAYTAMGDAVNVASRLEGRTKHYGVGILVGEATRAAARGIAFREVDRIRVKGRDEAVSVHEPLGAEADLPAGMRAELGMWDETLRAYRARRWDSVERGLGELLRMNPGSGLYRLYAGRIAAFRLDPPPAGWDGVTAFDEK